MNFDNITFSGGWTITLPPSPGELYGWFAGGFGIPTFLSIVDRIDYSQDTATASVRGPLSFARWGPAAAGGLAG